MIRTAALLLSSCLLAACSGGGGDEGGEAGAFAPARLLVMLVDPDDAGEVADLVEDVQGLGAERIGQTAFFVLHVPPGTRLDDLLKELDNDLRVILSELDYVGEAPEGDPVDVQVLGGDLLSSIPGQEGLAALDLPAAHAESTGAGVLVAVVDTGVDLAHPFFQPGQLDPSGFDFVGLDPDPTDERNFADDDGDGLADEQFGHGTFIASLVLTVAPDARVLPVRVLDAEGFGTSSTVAAGIVWAVDMGARVVNVSFDLPQEAEVLKEAIRYAHERDVLVVAAAGNDGTTELIFPARLDGVVAVAAVDALGIATPFTNRDSQVSLAAPGSDLIAAVPTVLHPAGTARWSGTSFAAPLVAGSAALVRSRFPALGREQVALRLRDSALPLDALNPSLAGKLGSGLVQPAAALR